MASRKPGDPLGREADVLYFRYCREHKGLASWCSHKGYRHEVGLHGGRSNYHRTAQYLIDGKRVRWDATGDYLMVPWPAWRPTFTRTNTVEFVPEDEDDTHYQGEWSIAFAAEERWETGRMVWAAIARHGLSRYRVQEHGDKVAMRKVRVVKADRPCFCWQRTCADIPRRLDWVREFGTDDDLKLMGERAYVAPHVQIAPGALGARKELLATYQGVYYDARRRQKRAEKRGATP